MTASVRTLNVSQVLDELHTVFPSLSAAYLFGSAARGQMLPDSDIDVAIDIGRALSATECWNAMQHLAVRAGREVDLVDFRTASDVLRHQVLTTGRRLFARDEVAQAIFEAAALSEYFDFIAQRAPLMRDIVERGRVYAR